MRTDRRRTPSALLWLLTAGLVLGSSLVTPAVAAVPPSPGPDVVLTGSGWGHSVGMSQYGARAMAQAGISGDDILTHYYSGTRIGTDVGPPDSSTVQVDLFRNRSIAGPGQVLLRAKPLTAGGSVGQAVGVRVVRDGVRSDFPLRSDAAWSVAREGEQFVLRDGGGGELARTTTPMQTYTDGSALLSLPQLGSAVEPERRAGTYRWGSIELGWDGSRMTPVLRQSMREYLRGIAEMPSSWESEALRAQAIAARTYAARRAGAVLSATPADQAYAGWDKEGDPTFGGRWVQAVDSTADRKVIAPDGSLAQTFYSSSHGLGRTESSQDSWAYSSAFSYLRSVEDPWSLTAGIGNPYRSWTATTSNTAFATAMGLARVNGVRIESRTAGGSPRVLMVDGWTPGGERITCRWSGGAACPANDAGAKGAGAKLRGPTSNPGIPARTVRVDGTVHNAAGMPSQQISAITLAPFTDDEDSVHQFNIGAVAASGITQGCTASTYCPKSAVGRGQMAAFLARALRLPAYSGPDRFTDIATSPQRAEINALAAAGRIGGFGDGSYRPGAPVTREQMATFLGRAFDVGTATGPDRFTDIGDSVHRQRINDVAARGLTGGCTSTRYCPKDLVTREQMASFLARATGVGV